MKNKKGFTLVEVIVSIVLVSIILVSMLTTLVKLKELYSEVHEDSDALVYSSSIARIINNDIMNNNGIRYASCNSQGDVCDIILGNDNKRKLEIVTKTSSKTEPDGKGTLKSLNSVSTLRYIDTTNPSDETMVYVRTLEANIYTTYDQSGNMKYTTSDGFNFNRMSLDQYEQDTSDGKKDVVTSLKVNIYDGIDETDQNFSAMIYGSGRYDDSGYRGRVFRIELDDNGSDTYRGTDAIDEVFGVGYFNTNTSHNLDEAITTINPPKKDGWMFSGYYHNTGSVNPVAIVDSEGNIVASSTHFLGDEIITNGVGRVQALWEQCKGGYEYIRDTGECRQKTYLVEFDKHGGTGGTNSITAKYRVLVPTVNIPSRPGYMFNGYFTSPNGAGKKYIDAQGKGTGIWLEADWTSSDKLHASWTARNDTPYKVVHWRQNIDAADAQNSSNYTVAETENKVGTTDTNVTPAVKSYAGFTSPSAQQITIAGDGSAVVNYYYKRNKYTITVNKGTGISSVSGGGTYHYGKSITINASMNSGYSWNRWTNSSGGQVTTTKNYSFNVSGAATYTANATANTNTAYTVKHYKQNLALNGYDLANTDNLTGTTDTSVTPGRKSYEGFTAPAAQTMTIKGDGTSSISYYYTRNSYYLDVNGELDGTTSGNTSGYGTFDVTVNGSKKADDKNDHNAQYPYGSSYTVNDIKPASGKSNIGNASYTGTIGASTTTVVIKLKTTSFTCAAGKYLPANKTTCADCLKGYYCPGGTWNFNASSNQGLNQCPEYYRDGTGMTAQSQCYITVPGGYRVQTAKANKTKCAANTFRNGSKNVTYGNTLLCSNCTGGLSSGEGATVCTDKCTAAGKTSMQSWNGASSLAVYGTVTLCDARDGNTYTVGKLPGGKVWMFQDLKLDVKNLASTINSSNTDHPGTLTASNISKFSYVTENTDYWGYTTSNYYDRVYDWIPGFKRYASGDPYDSNGRNVKTLEYVFHSNSGIYSMKLALANTNGTGSLCPKGWHLPNASTHEFCNAGRAAGSDYYTYSQVHDTGRCAYYYGENDFNYANIQKFYFKFRDNTVNIPMTTTKTVYNSDYTSSTEVTYGMIFKPSLYTCMDQPGISSPTGCNTSEVGGNGAARFWQSDGTAYGFSNGYWIPEGGGGVPRYGIHDANIYNGYYDGLPLRCVKD